MSESRKNRIKLSQMISTLQAVSKELAELTFRVDYIDDDDQIFEAIVSNKKTIKTLESLWAESSKKEKEEKAK